MLERRTVVQKLLEHRSSLVVVTGLGSATYDVAAAGDHERNFYLWGAMGGAAMVGLGISVSRPDVPVLVVTGDGEMLMGLGSLSTIALQAPRNLTIAVLDNHLYGETGGQETHTASVTKLPRVAEACGFSNVLQVDTPDDVERLASRVHDAGKGLLFASIQISPEPRKRIMTSRAGAVLMERTRASLQRII